MDTKAAKRSAAGEASTSGRDTPADQARHTVSSSSKAVLAKSFCHASALLSRIALLLSTAVSLSKNVGLNLCSV